MKEEEYIKLFKDGSLQKNILKFYVIRSGIAVNVPSNLLVQNSWLVVVE
ncbi:hypothetical protein [uncultured Clostridium sp.]|nr:hypothetical protein [uncultured Clostridium sp.]